MQLFSKCYPGHKSKLSELDPAKAMGTDGIGPKVLKLCAAALEPLCHPWCIPFEWKVHCITPIHKSGDKSIVSNYRPIALLSCVSKVLERLILLTMFLLSSLVVNLDLFMVGLHYSSSLFFCWTFFITLMTSYRLMPSILICAKLLIVSLMTSY